ncbi:hypothetical protein B7463_g5663, partial [Scytalidium lignicola]
MHIKSRKRQRTKCFTGCWTCRSRRVKCDEHQPLCHRCTLRGVHCEGYGVRLSWSRDAPDQTQDNAEELEAPRASRRTFHYDASSMVTRLSSPELDAMLERLDDCPTGDSQVEAGLFSVFPVQAVALQEPEEEPQDPNISLLSPGSNASSAISDSTFPGGCPSTHTIDTYETLTPEPGPVSVARPHPGLLDPEPSQENPYRNEGELDVIGDADFRPYSGIYEKSIQHSNIPSPGRIIHDLNRLDTVPHFPKDDQESCEKSAPSVQSSNVPLLRDSHDHHRPSRHLDLLAMPAHQKRLIHHWLTFVSRKLVLLDEPDNPCRTMMLPMALKGLLSSSQESTADIVTFHAICACSAYSLFELGKRKSEEDQRLALQHDQLAIVHLRHNLAQADKHDDQSFAMAIMACIAVDAISGTPRRWRAHVAGGLAYLTKLRSRGVSKEISSAFHQHIVAMAILCDFDVSSDLKAYLDEAEKLEFSFPYYGASSSFLRAHDRMNNLAASKTIHDAQELDSIELQLYLDFPAVVQGGSNKTHTAILHHMSKAFYYAGLVFFQRTVRRLRVDMVQELVERGIEELEAIALLSKGSSGSMIMWPTLILGAECASLGLQDRMRLWFKSKKDLGFRNVIVIDELINMLWSRRACGNSDITWQDLINTDHFDVFRL